MSGYLTKSNISECGNLASQIQQYFSLLAMSKTYDKKLCFSERLESLGYGMKFAKFLDIFLDTFDPKDESRFIGKGIIQEIGSNPEENIGFLDIFLDTFGPKYESRFIGKQIRQVCQGMDSNPEENINILDRFDLYTSWYYSEAEEEISRIKIKKNILSEAIKQLDIIRQGIDQIPIVGVHIRRGDYLLPQHRLYINLDHYYYNKAIEQLDIDKYHLLFFSDDIRWVQSNIHLIETNGQKTSIATDNSDYVDLALMSLCDHNIIANSSFSWMAAYLNKNPNKKIICPINYLQDDPNNPLATMINKNYFPETWKAI